MIFQKWILIFLIFFNSILKYITNFIPIQKQSVGEIFFRIEQVVITYFVFNEFRCVLQIHFFLLHRIVDCCKGQTSQRVSTLINNLFIYYQTINPLTSVGKYSSYENWPMKWPRFRRVTGPSRLACTQQTHCGIHASIFSHTRMTTRAGSLVYVRVESSCDQTGEDICGPTDHF